MLLIACLNVGNLFLVRAITQGRDSAIRAALGAARSRVMGQRLLECVLVAGFGGVIGAVVAHWGARFLLAVSPESLARAEDVGFDTGLLAFAVVLTACTGVRNCFDSGSAGLYGPSWVSSGSLPYAPQWRLYSPVSASSTITRRLP